MDYLRLGCWTRSFFVHRDICRGHTPPAHNIPSRLLPTARPPIPPPLGSKQQQAVVPGVSCHIREVMTIALFYPHFMNVVDTLTACAHACCCWSWGEKEMSLRWLRGRPANVQARMHAHNTDYTFVISLVNLCSMQYEYPFASILPFSHTWTLCCHSPRSRRR